MFRGLLIGILVSAPMGPIGMLCIQRTLNRGRWPAFFTGVGAGLSDLIYCLLTGLGLSFVTDFIQSNQSVLQVIGSIVLIVYAAYLFGANPSRALQPSSMQTGSYWKDFGTGFLFTFSNPLILFFIIGLFARSVSWLLNSWPTIMSRAISRYSLAQSYGGLEWLTLSTRWDVTSTYARCGC